MKGAILALAAAARATDQYNDDCRTCFLGNGTQLYEPAYSNFPKRWSSKVGVWELTEADVEAQVQLARQTEGNRGARLSRGALSGCREDLCCAERESDCYEPNVNAFVSIPVGCALALWCLVWCTCRFVPGAPLQQRAARLAEVKAARDAEALRVADLAKSGEA